MTHPHMPPGASQPKSQALMIGVILGVLVVAGAGVTWILMSGKSSPVAPATQPATATKPVAVVLEGPAIEADAQAMLNLYKEKQTDAEAQYNGKVVDVTGAIAAKIDTTFDGSQVIALEGGVQRFAGVRCVLNSANYFQLAEVEKGETVTIRGRCEGLTSDIILRDCAVLKKAP